MANGQGNQELRSRLSRVASLLSHPVSLLFIKLSPSQAATSQGARYVEFQKCLNSRLFEELLKAEARIRGYIRETPVDQSNFLSEMARAKVYLKLEHLQHTGSFKLRGAMNKVLSLSPSELQPGVIAASNGNHGFAVSFAAKTDGYCTHHLYENGCATCESQLGRIFRRASVLYGHNPVHAEAKARQMAEQQVRFSYHLTTILKSSLVRALLALSYTASLTTLTQFLSLLGAAG